MSKPAAFILATTDSISDELITRKSMLHDKLVNIFNANKKNNTLKGDLRPVLSDVTNSHVLYVREEYKPNVSIAYEYFKTSVDGGASPSFINPTTIKFNLTGNAGDFINDMVLHIRFSSIGVPDPINPTNGAYNPGLIRYRYANKPGIRLLNKVRLKYNEILVDEYTSRDLLFYDKFRIATQKEQGWNNLIGQENAKEGSFYHTDQRVTQVLEFKNGPQTPRTYQEPLDLWIPLIFWFNLDPAQSLIAGGIITLQQRIEVELAALNTIIEGILPDGSSFPLSPQNTNFNIEKMELYTKNIYLDTEVSDLFKNRASLSLIRVHKQQEFILDAPHKSLLLNQLKYPLEYMYAGVQPLSNTTNLAKSFNEWDIYDKRVIQEVSIPATIINPMTWPVLQLVTRTGTFYNRVPCITDFSIIAQTTRLYRDVPIDFFNRYTAWSYEDMTTQIDNSAYFIPFSLFTDRFQPSGYLQLSKVREFRIEYDGSDITKLDKYIMYISGIAINFLSVDSGGNALLKFAT